MSIITVTATITPRYLRGKTKDEVIDHVMRLLKENDRLRSCLKVAHEFMPKGTPKETVFLSALRLGADVRLPDAEADRVIETLRDESASQGASS